MNNKKQTESQRSKKVFAGSIVILMLCSMMILPESAEAGLFDSIGNFFEGIRDDARNELGRSRIGRELNRIVDDVIAVTEIVEELGNVAVMIGSATTPVGIANLAIQYGHDPDALFGRFQERVNTLRNQNPGTQLSEMEAAAALQSVLEEPVLPDGVYLGDTCVVDLSRCEDRDANSNTMERSYFWHHSCYLEGTIGKKNVNGRNVASCQASWVSTYYGTTSNVDFIDHTLGQYEWQQCSRVYLTPQEQNQFLASKNQQCTQPTIANHDLGDVCAVDYMSCSYGQYGVYNNNRVGTIMFDVLHTRIGSVRDYACETTYTISPLSKRERPVCETVYVGDREVNAFVAVNPEPVPMPIPPTVTPPPPPPATVITNPVPPAVLRGFQGPTGDRLEYIARSLGDIQNVDQQINDVYVFGRNGIKNIAPTNLTEKKKQMGDKLAQLGLIDKFSIDQIKKEVEGQTVPSPLNKIFKNEKVHVTIRRNSGVDVYYCVTVVDKVVTSFSDCSDSYHDSTLLVVTSESVVEEVQQGGDFNEMLDQERIVYQAVGFTNKAKFGVASLLVKVFG